MLQSATKYDDKSKGYIEKPNSPITTQYDTQTNQTANEPFLRNKEQSHSLNEVRWRRENRNRLGNSSSYKFSIKFSTSNHPVYRYIQLDLFSSNNQPEVVLEIGFEISAINVVEEIASKLRSSFNAEVNEFEIKKWRDSTITLNISILNSNSENIFLNIFEKMNEVENTKLNSEAFFVGVSDMLFTVIPAQRAHSKEFHRERPEIEKNMSNGEIKQVEKNNPIKLP